MNKENFIVNHKKQLILTCGGTSNLDHAIELAVRKLLSENPTMEKICLARLFTQPNIVLKKFQSAGQILIVNTCNNQCMSRIIKQFAAKQYNDKIIYLDLSQQGFKKKNIKDVNETLILLVQKFKKALN